MTNSIKLEGRSQEELLEIIQDAFFTLCIMAERGEISTIYEALYRENGMVRIAIEEMTTARGAV